MSNMADYSNAFDEAIANCPYHDDWNEQRKEIVKIIEVFGSKMSMCRTFRSFGDKDYQVIMFFFLYDGIYMYLQAVENGLIEAAQLEKIMDLDAGISFVMYSNVENAQEFFPIFLNMLKAPEPILYEVDNSGNPV